MSGHRVCGLLFSSLFFPTSICGLYYKITFFSLCRFDNFITLSETKRSIFQGIEKKHAKLQSSERAVVARHEAGHAVVGTAVANLLPGQPRVEVKTRSFPPGQQQFTFISMLLLDSYLRFVIRN